jgi:hypothetical protein
MPIDFSQTTVELPTADPDHIPDHLPVYKIELSPDDDTVSNVFFYNVSQILKVASAYDEYNQWVATPIVSEALAKVGRAWDDIRQFVDTDGAVVQYPYKAQVFRFSKHDVYRGVYLTEPLFTDFIQFIRSKITPTMLLYGSMIHHIEQEAIANDKEVRTELKAQYKTKLRAQLKTMKCCAPKAMRCPVHDPVVSVVDTHKEPAKSNIVQLDADTLRAIEEEKKPNAAALRKARKVVQSHVPQSHVPQSQVQPNAVPVILKKRERRATQMDARKLPPPPSQPSQPTPPPTTTPPTTEDASNTPPPHSDNAMLWTGAPKTPPTTTSTPPAPKEPKEAKEAKAPAKNPTKVPVPEVLPPFPADLKALKGYMVPALRALCKAKRVAGYNSRLKKAELVDLLVPFLPEPLPTE